MDKKEDAVIHFLCYECGCRLYGVPAEDDMKGITVATGKCPVCGKEDVKLIPIRTFLNYGE